MGQRDRFGGQFDAVLAAARTGAPWAIERMFIALSPVVEGYLRVQGSTEPEDLTSEVFLAVIRNLSGFDGDERGFRSWVFTIAHRRLLDERRRLRRRPPPDPLAEAPDQLAAELVAPDDVEGTIDRALGADRVRALCDRLAPSQREVLLLRLLGDLSIDQTAAAVGKTAGAVKALQRRALLNVARLVEHEGVTLQAGAAMTDP
ncbi:MAG TPA: sigma-70 family RNA polymerase sigma factor [Acidimicrobiales bacterium]|jgi:RNA polymerase sigma-70 factor (ECF subfamily)|nr:sigma-70 family RNA polymerase sigma factor [Acidimicrobiales bacterium]